MTASTSKTDQPPYLLVGQILRPHGLMGEVRMQVFTDYPERLAELDELYLSKSPESPDVKRYALQHIRLHQSYVLLTLQGINDRTQADSLRELFVMIAHEDAVPLEAGEFYLYQVVGLEARLPDAGVLGKITDILETGANNVYIIQSPQYGEILIPATDQTIVSIDLENGFMIVNPPEGLLPSV